jgi:hypothetical protein
MATKCPSCGNSKLDEWTPVEIPGFGPGIKCAWCGSVLLASDVGKNLTKRDIIIPPPGPYPTETCNTGLNYLVGCWHLHGLILEALDADAYLDFSTVWSKLSENLRKEGIYGSTPGRRADRAEIIYGLIELAGAFGKSFNALCLLPDTTPVLEDGTKVPMGPKIYVRP